MEDSLLVVFQSCVLSCCAQLVLSTCPQINISAQGFSVFRTGVSKRNDSGAAR